MGIRHEWYQADSKVVVTVLLKKAEEKNYAVKIELDSLLFTATDYELSLNLFKPINVEKSSHKVTPSKVEITLVKEIAERWEQLEKKVEACSKPTMKKVPNWDKVAKEIQEKEIEESVGDEGVQLAFQQIYGSSSEEVRRAMNKSFIESGGTVLSTNWKEIGNKKVDAQPPDGTEFKEWKN